MQSEAMQLLRRMRAARESWVDAGRFGFLLRRPTGLQWLEWRRKGATESDILRDVVVGWRAVTEADLVPGGGSDEIPFDADLCCEWLADNPNLASPIIERLQELVTDRARELEDTAKN